jgi:Domain of unknown function (DUF4926)
MRPKDLDVVKLRSGIPDHDLPAGAEGTIVNDIQTEGLPRAYLVEFSDDNGITQALIHVPEDNLEVVWQS